MYPSSENSIFSDLESIAWPISTLKANNGGGMALFGFMVFKSHFLIDACFKGFSIAHSISSIRYGSKVLVPVSVSFREG